MARVSQPFVILTHQRTDQFEGFCRHHAVRKGFQPAKEFGETFKVFDDAALLGPIRKNTLGAARLQVLSICTFFTSAHAEHHAYSG